MYTFPFTEDSVREEICGRAMMVGLMNVGGNGLFNVREVVLRRNRDDEGVGWRVQNGLLLLEDEKGKATHEIDSVKIVNGKVCMGGYPYREAGLGKPVIAVMYERQDLGSDFHVLVSSHVDYEKVALPRLVRSLTRAGIPENRVTVIVGGGTGGMSQESGYRRVPVAQELLGSTAIEYLVSDDCDIDSEYVVLLHDTCEAMPGFAESVMKFDVGIPFDVYWFWNEIGLWSMNMMRRVKEEGFERHPIHKIPSRLVEMAKIVRKFAKREQRKVKDVYGHGEERRVFEFPELAVKKYVGKKMTGGRP